METKFSDLIGKTLINIKIDRECDIITFTDSEGADYEMQHYQDCCESVVIDDVVGDINDLIGTPITMAEEVRNSEDAMGKEFYDSFTWTFYKLATIKGYVTIKWWGESNGYYSEDVDFQKVSV